MQIRINIDDHDCFQTIVIDPFQPPSTARCRPYDNCRVHPDAEAIIERLKGAVTESDVRKIVWDSFKDLFMDEIAGDRDSSEFRDAVFDIWRYYCR